jgi:phospholipid N-methyltransferase
MCVLYYIVIGVILSLVGYIGFIVWVRSRYESDTGFVKGFNQKIKDGKFFDLLEYCASSPKHTFDNEDIHIFNIVFSIFWLFTIPIVLIFLLSYFLYKIVFKGALYLVKYVTGFFK